MTPHDAALIYLKRGYSVIPCLPNDKKPAVKWQDYQHRHPTTEEIDKWWTDMPDANIGIVTGKISGITVLDIDGEVGQDSISSMAERPQPTRVIQTPKGWHFYYDYRPDLHTGAGFRPGLDIRSDGGYVVAPPSIINTRQYKVKEDRDIVPLTVSAGAFARNGATAKGEEQPTWVADALTNGVDESQRNDMATRLAGYFRSRSIPKDIVISTLTAFAGRCSPPMSEAELNQTIDSVFKYPIPSNLPTETPVGETVISAAGLVTLVQEVSGHLIKFEADDVRDERTGPHAHAHIHLDKVRLAHSVINLWRDEDRVRLVNSAYSHLTKNLVLEASYSKSQMKVDLDSFLLAVEDIVEKAWVGQDMEGLDEIPPIEFLLKPYVVRGAGSIMFAPPGSGKSWLMILMAVSIDAGISTYWPVEQGKVLYVNLERSQQSVQRRLTIVNKLLGLPQKRPLLSINAKGRSLSRLSKPIRRTVLEHGVEIMFLDSISRAGAGSLVKDDVANSIVDTMHSICNTWMAIGHSPREDASHLYGSVHFDAGQDIGIKVVPEQRESKLLQGLEIVKANDIQTGQKRVYEMEFSEDSVLTSFSVLGTDRGHHLFTERKASKLDEAISYMESLADPAITTLELAQAINVSMSSSSRILSNTEYFTKLPRRGKEQPYGLVIRGGTPPPF